MGRTAVCSLCRMVERLMDAHRAPRVRLSVRDRGGVAAWTTRRGLEKSSRILCLGREQLRKATSRSRSQTGNPLRLPGHLRQNLRMLLTMVTLRLPAHHRSRPCQLRQQHPVRPWRQSRRARRRKIHILAGQMACSNRPPPNRLDIAHRHLPHSRIRQLLRYPIRPSRPPQTLDLTVLHTDTRSKYRNWQRRELHVIARILISLPTVLSLPVVGSLLILLRKDADPSSWRGE